MSKSAAFWQEFGSSLKWTMTVGGVMRVGIQLLAGAGLLGTVVAAVKGADPWLIMAPSLLALAYLSFVTGSVVEKIRGPEVEVHPLKLDLGPHKVFYLRLTAKSRKVKPVVKIVHLAYLPDTKPIECSLEAHWRGPQLENGILELPGEPAEFGLLGVEKYPSGHPKLFAWPKGGKSDPLSRDVPPEQQAVITMKIVVGCSTPVGEKEWRSGREQNFTYRVIPDPGSEVGYKVESRESSVLSGGAPNAGQSAGRLIDRFRATVKRIAEAIRHPKA